MELTPKMSHFLRIVFFLLITVPYGHALCEGKNVTDIKNHETSLLECLHKQGYEKKLTFGSNSSLPVRVKIHAHRFALVQFNDLDNTVEVQLNLRYTWNKKEFMWDPKEYGGQKYLVVPGYHVWKPVPSILHNRNAQRQYMEMMKVRLWYNGTTEWFVFIHSSTVCYTDLSDFPFDTQMCDLGIYHYPYTSNELDITMDSIGHAEIITPRWTERSTNVRHNTYTEYRSDGTEATHSTFSFIFVIDRKATYYDYVIVSPSICVLIFVLFLLFVPIQSNQRFIMAGFLFMSIMALYLSTQHMLPPGAGQAPFIAKFMTFIFVILLITVIISILTFCIFHSEAKQMPPIIKQFFLNSPLKKLASIPTPLSSIRREASDDSGPDKQSSTTYSSRVSSPAEQLERTLDDLQKYLSRLASEKDSNFQGSAFEELVANEWKQVAVIIEKIFMILLVSISVIATLSMFSKKFNIHPHEYEFM